MLSFVFTLAAAVRPPLDRPVVFSPAEPSSLVEVDGSSGGGHLFLGWVGELGARVFGTPKPPPSALEQLVNEGDRDGAVTPDADHIADQWAEMNKKEFGKPTPDPVQVTAQVPANAESMTMRSASSATSFVNKDAQEVKPMNVGKMLHDMEGMPEQSQLPAEEAVSALVKDAKAVDSAAFEEPTTTIEPAADIIADWTRKLESLHTTPRKEPRNDGRNGLEGLIQAMSSHGNGFAAPAAEPQTEAPPNPLQIAEQWTNKLEAKYGTPAPKDPYPSMITKIMLAQIDPKNDGLAALDAQDAHSDVAKLAADVAKPAAEASAEPQVAAASEQSHASYVAQLYAKPKAEAAHPEPPAAEPAPAKTASGTSKQAYSAPSLLERVYKALGMAPQRAAAPSSLTQVAASEEPAATWQAPSGQSSFAQQANAEMRVAERSASAAMTWSEAAITKAKRAAMSTPIRAVVWTLMAAVALFLTYIWRDNVATREAAVVKIQALYRGCKFRDRLFADVMSPDAESEGAGLGDVAPDATQ